VVFGVDELVHVIHRRKIHEISCVYGDVSPVFQVGAGLAASLQRLILEIVYHQTSVMNDFSQTAREIDVLIGFIIIQLPAKLFSKHHPEKWSPLFTSAVEQVIDWLQCGLVDSLQISIFVFVCFGALHVWIRLR
jgi:hypothetical protein